MESGGGASPLVGPDTSRLVFSPSWSLSTYQLPSIFRPTKYPSRTISIARSGLMPFRFANSPIGIIPSGILESLTLTSPHLIAANAPTCATSCLPRSWALSLASARRRQSVRHDHVICTRHHAQDLAVIERRRCSVLITSGIGSRLFTNGSLRLLPQRLVQVGWSQEDLGQPRTYLG